MRRSAIPAGPVPASVEHHADRAGARDFDCECSLVRGVQKQEVRSFADFDRADFMLKPEDAGGVEGRGDDRFPPSDN